MEYPTPAVNAPPGRERGFSLLELIVTTVVAGVLLSVGLPSFSDFIELTRLDTVSDRLIAHLALARNHAITHRLRVTVCARDGDQCGAPGDWSNGWIVFENRISDKPGQDIDEGDRVIASYREIADDVDIRFRRDRAYVYYRNTGTGYPAGTFRICNRTGHRNGTSIVLSFTGRPRFGNDADEPVACNSTPPND